MNAQNTMKKTLALGLIASLLWMGGCTRHHITADTRHELHTTHRVEMTVDVNIKLDEMLARTLRWQEDFHDRAIVPTEDD